MWSTKKRPMLVTQQGCLTNNRTAWWSLCCHLGFCDEQITQITEKQSQGWLQAHVSSELHNQQDSTVISMSWLRLHRWGCIRSIRTPAFNLSAVGDFYQQVVIVLGSDNETDGMTFSPPKIPLWYWHWCTACLPEAHSWIFSFRSEPVYTQTCDEICFSPQVFIFSGECLFKLTTTMYAVEERKGLEQFVRCLFEKNPNGGAWKLSSTQSGYSLHSHRGQSSLWNKIFSVLE